MASPIALPIRTLAASLYGSAGSLSVIHRLRNSKPARSPSAEKFLSGFSRARAMDHPIGAPSQYEQESQKVFVPNIVASGIINCGNEPAQKKQIGSRPDIDWGTKIEHCSSYVLRRLRCFGPPWKTPPP